MRVFQNSSAEYRHPKKARPASRLWSVAREARRSGGGQYGVDGVASRMGGTILAIPLSDFI